MRTPFVDPHSAAGRLKQRLARILTRSTCTTTNAAAASSGGTATATAFVSLAKTNAHTAASSSHPEPEAPPSPYFCTPCTYDYERPKADRGTRPRRTRSASLIHISVDCTGGAASGRRSAHSDAPLLQHLLSEQVPARDVVGGTKQSKGGGRSKLTTTRSSPSASRRHCSSSSSSWGRARARRPSSTPTPYSWSSSSSSATATDDELAPFSGSDDEEGGGGGEAADMRTLFSSLSFSSDPTSSEFYRTNGGRSGNGNASRRSHRNTASRRRGRRARAPRRALSRSSGGDPAAPPDAFRPLVSVETTRRTTERSERSKEDKGLNNAKKLTMTMLGAAAAAEEEEEEAIAAGAGMAVVKRSSNPYLDFRSSMVEMVVERRIASVGKMEELLGSYLSLNSPRHHPAILAAFEDVWEAVFGEE
jgi:uncharacterized protein (TIGR01568 family)